MGVKVMLDYPQDGVVEEYPEADCWVTDKERTLTVGIDDETAGAKKLVQYNSDRWQKVWLYNSEPTVGEDKNKELEPEL